MYKIKRFFKKIIELFQWLPVIWKDEDWDYAYLLYLIKFKIKRMKKYIGESEILACNDKVAISVKMDNTLHHIDSFLNSYEVFHENHEPPFEIEQKSVPTENPNLSRYITIRKDTRKPLTKDEEQKYAEYLVRMNEFEQKCWDNIFDSLKKEAQNWWE